MILDSSDEDDEYTNAAARLKVLKSMKPVVNVVAENFIDEILKTETTEKNDIDPIIILNDCDLSERISIHYPVARLPRRNAARGRQPIINSPLVSINLDDSSSSPIPVEDITEIIDSDSEIININEKNYMIDVKIRWRSREIERMKLGMNDKFAKVFQYFASLKNVPENQILLTKRDIPINHSDTPASINLKIIDILEGGTVDASFAVNADDAEPVCKIKLQSSSSTRHFLTYDACRSQSFEKLFEYCAKEKNISPSKIKLSFDGEAVSASDTPDSLDLDDEACFDLQIAE